MRLVSLIVLGLGLVVGASIGLGGVGDLAASELTPPAQPSPLPTAPADALPTPMPTPPSLPSPPYRLAQPATQLTGITHIWQRWSNCGPSTLAMALSYFGQQVSQAELAAALKGNEDDRNVSPEEIVNLVRRQGWRAVARANGDADRLRLLLSNGLPVMVETWLEKEKPGDGVGHYRLLTGYDDASRQWTVFDSFVMKGVRANQPYAGIHMTYDELDQLWKVFNRQYVLIYTDALEPLVASILGQDADDAAMWQRALLQAQAEVAQRPDDPYARFNLGSDQVSVGQFELAVAAYEQAMAIGLPWRMLWYQFGPFRAYYETGRYQELVALADATINPDGEIEEIYYWRGIGLAALGLPGAARQAWQRALELRSGYGEAAAALAELGQPPAAD
jgi:tetratricopeptide (TPR) repeat protein